VCSGAVDDPVPSAAVESSLAHQLLVAADGRPLAEQKKIRTAWFYIETVLQRVGKTLRWRFGVFGDDSVFSSTRLDVALSDGAEVLELTPMPSAGMGDNIARIGADGLRAVAELVVHPWSNLLLTSYGESRGTSATPARAAVSSWE